MTIGQRIKKRRNELGLSVDEVAKKLGKNRATVYRYEKDDIKDLPITVLEPLASVLETTPADLMGWEEPKPDIAIVSSDNEIIGIIEYMSPPKKERAKRLVQYYSMLNEIGQKKALDNLEDLSKIYTEKEPVKYDFTPPEHSMVAEASNPYLAAAHNDHLDEEGEIEKVKSDLAKLKKPNRK